MGTLTSAEARRLGGGEGEQIVFIAPIPKTDQLTGGDKLHPYVFRIAAHHMEGRSAAEIWPSAAVTKSPTIAFDYALRPGRDRPSSSTSRNQAERCRSWTSSGRSSASRTTTRSSRPDGQEAGGHRVVDLGGFFVTYAKQGKALGMVDAVSTTSSAWVRRPLRRPPSRWATDTRWASGQLLRRFYWGETAPTASNRQSISK